MSTGWNAAGVRGHGLLRRRLGADGVARLAGCASLDEGLALLEATPYGRDVRSDMDLGGAQRAVSATVLWHLRILAGWGPPLGSTPLRLLAAGYELANITDHLGLLAGRPGRTPYDLGSAATSWSAVRQARTTAEVRQALARSAWGDPGSEDPGVVRLALQLTWARWVADGVPGAGGWAAGAAALVLARVLVTGASLGEAARRDADRLLGSRRRSASSPTELAPLVPPDLRAAVREVSGPEDLWLAEAAWWRRVEADADSAAARPRAQASSATAVVALLAADARRVRAALAVAAHGGDGAGVLDAVA